MLEALLGSDAGLQPLRALLIARTEGNPFFLEESVRTLVETQVLTGERGAYRLARALPSIQVPSTVQAILAARMDRLPPEEKTLLQTAAVVGKDIPFPLLQAIADQPEEGLRQGLGHLQTAEFLYEASLFPELEYTFKHALTHEVAYGSLLQERRRGLHARIMEAMERLAPDRLAEQAERLAHHALRGEVWDKAVPYLRQAGAKALERSAYRDAAACFEQALGALAHLPESRATRELAIDLRLDLRTSLFLLGELGRVLDYLREAEPLAEALGDQRRLGRIVAQMALSLRLAGDYERAVAAGQRALGLAETLQDLAIQVSANLNLGQAYHDLGNYRRTIEFLGRTVDLLQGDLIHQRFDFAAPPSVVSRTWLVYCLVELGEFAEGRVRADEAARVAEAVDHPLSLMYAHLAHGLLCLRRGEPGTAIPPLERARELCEGWNLRLTVPLVASFLGLAYARSEQIPHALPLLQHGGEATPRAHLSLRMTNLGEGYWLAGRREDATACARRALQVSREQKERGYEAYALHLLGEIASHGDPPEGESVGAHFRQALALAEELGMRPLQAHCHLGLGKLHRRTGDRKQAQQHLTAATAMYREMDLRFWLEQTEAELSQRSGGR